MNYKTNNKWVSEIEEGMSKAIAFSNNNHQDIRYIWRYAISHAIESMNLTDLDTIEDIEEYVAGLIDQDWSCDPDSKNSYRFHYASTYIFSHVPAGYLDEMQGDRVMDYVNEKIDLFSKRA